MMKKLYISLPISGHPLDEVKKKAQAAKEKWEIYYDVVTPFDINPDQNKSYAHYMGKDIEALLECGAILMCKGWVHSKGCNAEYQIAKIYEIQIIDEV